MYSYQLPTKLPKELSSVPEPAPIKSGKIVPDLLIEELETAENINNGTIRNVIKLIKARDNFGRQKYGQPLMTKDGRNSIEDAKQEFGDLLQYVYKARLNNEDVSSIRKMMTVLHYVLRA